MRCDTRIESHNIRKFTYRCICVLGAMFGGEFRYVGFGMNLLVEWQLSAMSQLL